MKLLKVIQTYGKKKKRELKTMLLGVQSVVQDYVAAKSVDSDTKEKQAAGTQCTEQVARTQTEEMQTVLPVGEEEKPILTEMMNLPDMDTVANDNRRFTMMVEEILEPTEGYGVAVAGKVHGMVHKGDEVYLMDAGGRILASTVAVVEMRVEGQLIPVDFVADAVAGIRFADIYDTEKVELLSILTSIRPQPVIDVAKACENPVVLGMSYEYYRFRGHGLYMSKLFQSIVHGHYVLPVKTDVTPWKQESGADTLQIQGQEAGQQELFYRLPHPSEKGKEILPVFTDWEEMRAWDVVQQSKGSLRTLTLDFSELAMLVTEDRDDDLAINLFHGSPLILSADAVCDILGSESYQAEFGTGTSYEKYN
ncbi:MAG: SseB family protein [Lachnospiraceae bacterium]|nr:SseB family protein [Lachnospiraceae bacterium]